MCVNLPLGDFNPSPYPYHPYPTITYTCEVTIVPRVCNGNVCTFFFFFNALSFLEVNN